ncbi:cell division protein ZapA [Caldisalinibacter kiritimatiensis]|uniref:Cell division protein ZapA n=1 Tax=Caldisalinibacter kiritimatiensis TaxID=1304284 RepID=R1CQI1_9FIRM|nr:cell division protein ZapA [Caldisalinibacter kiritimatiensis]EOD00926.1 hypothetical protein L21TH_1034 [Caldisalinibacter kiritimatiensis]
MTNRRKVTVKINNNEYTVVGEESEEYIKSIAEFVDKQFKEIYEGNGKLTKFMSAILTAFNIADKYYRTHKELSELKEEVVEPLKELEYIKKELELKEKQLEEAQTQRDNYKEKLFEVKKELEINRKKVKQQEQALNLKENELQKSQKIINELQNKLFENQLELVQTKKELNEFVKTIDKEKISELE